MFWEHGIMQCETFWDGRDFIITDPEIEEHYY